VSVSQTELLAPERIYLCSHLYGYQNYTGIICQDLVCTTARMTYLSVTISMMAPKLVTAGIVRYVVICIQLIVYIG